MNIEEIVKKHSDTVYKVAYNYFFNPHDAEDIQQTVFLNLLKQPLHLATLEEEKAYLIRMTINACHNLKKSAWKRKVFFLEQQGESSYEQDFLNEDYILLPLLQKLPRKYREVLFLHYYEDYSVGEIGIILQRKPNLISTQLKRGKEKLKLMLGERKYEEFI